MDVMRELATPATTFAVDTQTHAAAEAALAAPAADLAWTVVDATVSASTAPTAAVSVTLKDGNTTIKQIELSANAFSAIPLVPSRGFKCSAGNAVVLDCPDAGVGVKVSVTLAGFVSHA